MWQQAAAPSTYTWEQAKAYCPTLTLAGHSDWRLPTRIELVSLVDFGRSAPAISGLREEPSLSPVRVFRDGPLSFLRP